MSATRDECWSDALRLLDAAREAHRRGEDPQRVAAALKTARAAVERARTAPTGRNAALLDERFGGRAVFS